MPLDRSLDGIGVLGDIICRALAKDTKADVGHPLGIMPVCRISVDTARAEAAKDQPAGDQTSGPKDGQSVVQPITAAFTSASMKGTYWPKLSANIATSFFACAS